MIKTNNKSVAMKENAYTNSEFSPHQYLHFLLEQTTDGTLVIPRWDEGEIPAHYDCYDMRWNEERCEQLCREFDNLIDSLKRIADGEYLPEIWDVYNGSFFAAPIIVCSQRLCKLFEMNAPEIEIRKEEMCLIEAMAIDKFAIDYVPSKEAL